MAEDAEMSTHAKPQGDRKSLSVRYCVTASARWFKSRKGFGESFFLFVVVHVGSGRQGRLSAGSYEWTAPGWCEPGC